MNDFIAHILVVDDDDGIRSLIKKFLNENNFLVTTANSAENAKEKILIVKFDLIILDVMMPGKSGLDFIMENKSNIDTPIILLTAKGETEDRVSGLEIGADDYLPKPFEPKELVLRIKNILNKTKHAHIYIHRMHTYIYLYILCMHVCMYACMPACMHACMSVCMHVCICCSLCSL